MEEDFEVGKGKRGQEELKWARKANTPKKETVGRLSL